MFTPASCNILVLFMLHNCADSCSLRTTHVRSAYTPKSIPKFSFIHILTYCSGSSQTTPSWCDNLALLILTPSSLKFSYCTIMCKIMFN